MDTREKDILAIFVTGSAIFYALLAWRFDSFQGSRAFWIPAAVVFLSGLTACVMGAYASRLEPLKAVPWIMGSMAAELFIPMFSVIWLKIDGSLLVKSEELVIILKYLLIMFFFNLAFEKTLTLTAFKKNDSKNGKISKTSDSETVPKDKPKTKTDTQ